MNVTMVNGRLRIADLQMTSDELMFLRGLQGRQFHGREISVDATFKNILHLSMRIENFDDDALAFLKRARGVNAEGPTELKFKLEPMKHQLDCFLRTKDELYHAYFMEMGTGKTKVTLDVAAHLFLQKKIDTLLVLAPNGVHEKWAYDEVPKHLSDQIERWSIAVRLADLRILANLPSAEKLSIVALNIESCSRDDAYKEIKRLLKNRHALCVVDESTRIKTPSAARTRRIWKIGNLCTYRRILTGSPTPQGQHDLYAQFRFLNPSIIGSETYTDFKVEYAIISPDYGQVVGGKNRDSLMALINPHTFRARKEDCLDLPPKVYMEWKTGLSAEQIAALTKLKNDLVIEYKGVRMTIEHKMTVALRIQQICAGHLPKELNDDENVIPLPAPRLELMTDIVEDSGQRNIVWCRFKSDLQRCSDALKARGIESVIYENRDSLVRWKSNNVQVLISTPARSGIGLDMVEATNVVYYMNSDNAEERWQSEDRCHRIGQTNKVTYHDIIAPGTMDRRILSSLKDKKNVNDVVMSDPTAIEELLTYWAEQG